MYRSPVAVEVFKVPAYAKEELKTVVKAVDPPDPPPVPLTTLRALLLCVVCLVHPVGAEAWKKTQEVLCGMIPLFELRVVPSLKDIPDVVNLAAIFYPRVLPTFRVFITHSLGLGLLHSLQ